jgi:hypothetical protein
VTYKRIRKAGGKIISQDEANFEAWAIEQPNLTSCVFCPWTFKGTVAEGTIAFAEHRAAEHSDIPFAKKRRRR